MPSKYKKLAALGNANAANAVLRSTPKNDGDFGLIVGKISFALCYFLPFPVALQG